MIKPRQTVNIQCRQLTKLSVISRQKYSCPRCGVAKIINSLDGSGDSILPATEKAIQVAPATSIHRQYQEGRISSAVVVDAVQKLVEKVAKGEVEIYNEFSLQHELGILVREEVPERLVQFERNVSYFGLNKLDFEKREIDIVVYDRNSATLDAAIELKFPRNGQHPEQMFSFCKDIAFIEQLKESGFNKAYFVVFAEDRLFYEGSTAGIYGYFRGGKKLTGRVGKPTGKKDKTLTIRGEYAVKWSEVCGPMKFAVIEAQ